ncbi:MAG: glycosyltransferase family 4 protein [Prosthecobacter sp.]
MNPRLLVIGNAPLLRVNRPAYRHLHALGWEVRLVVPVDDGRFGCFQPELEAGLEITELPFVGPTVRRWTLSGLEDLMTSVRPHVVLVDGEPDSLVAEQLLAVRQRQPFHLTVTTCENFYFSFLDSVCAGDFKRTVRDLMLRRVLARTRGGISHVFTLGQDSREAMRRMGFGHERTSVIPLGFDENGFHPDSARRLEWRQKLGLEGVVVGYFGRLIPEKGIHILIESLAGLTDLPFTFLMDDFQADGDYQKSLRSQVASQGIAERTRFVHVTHEEMPGCLNAVDIVAVPSFVRRYWKEQYGRIVPEAMASGCAVIATSSGTLPELVGPHGLVIQPESVASLTEALRALLTDEGRRQRHAEGGSRHALEHLSAAAQARLQNEVFQKLLAASR